MRRSFTFVLIAALACALAWPGATYAETYTSMEVDGHMPAALAGDTEIEKLTIAWHEAHANLTAAQDEAARIQSEIDSLEEKLVVQQTRGTAAARQLYIMQENPMSVIEPILSIDSLGDFLSYVDTLDMLTSKSKRSLETLHATQAELDAARESQAAVVETAQGRADEAASALKQVQDGRAAAQATAQATAIAQASKLGGKIAPRQSDIDAKAKRDREKKELEKSGKKAKKKDDESDSDIDFSLPVTASSESQPLTSNTGALSDDADWYADRDEFIAEWSARIDAYLAGSPLEGQGVNFAASAWKWGVDPRWSPAISNTESSKGAYCIRPHNAWGWGAADSDPYGLASQWDSWEEAIDAHVAGLARGYGYTISISKAQKYCSSWSSWYNNTLAQMAMI